MTPRCGHCKYDLTGATGNRCPECGLLFIEAGVDLRPQNKSRGRTIGIALLMAVMLLVGMSLALSARAYERARAARDRAIAQEQAAMIRQQAIQAKLADQSANSPKSKIRDSD
jgi:hypothetical protein